MKQFLESGLSVARVAEDMCLSRHTIYKKKESFSDVKLSQEEFTAVSLKIAGRDNAEIASVVGISNIGEVQRMFYKPHVVEYAAGKLGVGINTAFQVLIREERKKTVVRPSVSFRDNLSVVFDLSYREEKLKVRKMLLDTAFSAVKGDVSLFTLPGTEWLFERDVLIRTLQKRNKVKITALERDLSTFLLSKKNLDNVGDVENIHFFNSTVEEYLSSLPGRKDVPLKFNLVWLDWMGQMCKSALASYIKLLKHIKPPAILACTHMTCREVTEIQEIYKECVELCPGLAREGLGLREIGIPVILQAIVRLAGLKSEVVINHPYREQGKAPMTLVALKITK